MYKKEQDHKEEKGCVILQRNVPHKEEKNLKSVSSLPISFLCNAVMPSFFQHIGQLQIVKLNRDYIYKDNLAILYLERQVHGWVGSYTGNGMMFDI